MVFLLNLLRMGWSREVSSVHLLCFSAVPILIRSLRTGRLQESRLLADVNRTVRQTKDWYGNAHNSIDSLYIHNNEGRSLGCMGNRWGDEKKQDTTTTCCSDLL